MDMEEPINFNNIESRFCVAICLLVVYEIDNVIVIFRSYSQLVVC